MAYMDFLERDIEVKFSGKFRVNDLYKEISRWAKKNQYDIQEITYEVKKGDDSQSVKIVLEISKKISDYAKIGIFTALIGSELKTVKQKNKILQEGNMLASLSTFIKRDYEDVWSRKNMTRFFREFYDKFIGKSHFEIDEKRINKDSKSLKNTIKDYFKAPILKK
jgi:hypothetical protein